MCKEQDQTWRALTATERRLVALVVQGWTMEQIGPELGMTTEQVRQLQEDLLERLGMAGRSALVARAIVEGWTR